MIHSRALTTDAEKVAYLRHSLQHKPANYITEELSGTGSEYSEAVECLQKSSDRPCALNYMHVRTIVKPTVEKDGSVKKLWCLRNVYSQYLRTLKGHQVRTTRSIHHFFNRN